MTQAKIYDGADDSTTVTETTGIITIYGDNGSYGGTYGPTTCLGNNIFLQSPGISNLIIGKTEGAVTLVKQTGVPILPFTGQVIIEGQ